MYKFILYYDSKTYINLLAVVETKKAHMFSISVIKILFYLFICYNEF